MALRLSADDDRDAERRADGVAAAAARLRRGRAASGQRQGSGRLRQPGRSARRGDAARGADQGAARLRLPHGGERRQRVGDNWAWRWVVDPLDGTSNFLHGIPHWAISIGLERRLPDGGSEMRRRRGLCAGRRRDVLGGEGRRRVPQRPPAARLRPARSQGGDVRHRHSVRDRARAAPARLRPHARHADAAGRRHPALRRGGARSRLGRRRAATTGSGSSASSRGTCRPGLLIVREAGGYATDPDGGDPRESGDVVAANPHLHPVLRDAVADGLRRRTPAEPDAASAFGHGFAADARAGADRPLHVTCMNAACETPRRGFIERGHAVGYGSLFMRDRIKSSWRRLLGAAVCGATAHAQVSFDPRALNQLQQAQASRRPPAAPAPAPPRPRTRRRPTGRRDAAPHAPAPPPSAAQRSARRARRPRATGASPEPRRSHAAGRRPGAAQRHRPATQCRRCRRRPRRVGPLVVPPAPPPGVLLPPPLVVPTRPPPAPVPGDGHAGRDRATSPRSTAASGSPSAPAAAT